MQTAVNRTDEWKRSRRGLMQKKERARGNGGARGRFGAPPKGEGRGEARMPSPRNARPQKTRGTAIVLSAGAAKSARGSPHHRTCLLLPPSFRLFLLSPRVLPLRPVISLLGPEYYDFVTEGFVGRFGVARFANGDACSRFSRVFHRSRFEWNVYKKEKEVKVPKRYLKRD